MASGPVMVPVEVIFTEIETGVFNSAMMLLPETPPAWLKVASCWYPTPRTT